MNEINQSKLKHGLGTFYAIQPQKRIRYILQLPEPTQGNISCSCPLKRRQLLPGCISVVKIVCRGCVRQVDDMIQHRRSHPVAVTLLN